MSYNLRSTSYVGRHLDRELLKRGARTSGSTERKQERLQRFMDMEDTVKQAVIGVQSSVREREIARATELVFEGVRDMIRDLGREGAVPEIREMLMRCPPEVVDRVRHYLYDGKNGFVRGSTTAFPQ